MHRALPAVTTWEVDRLLRVLSAFRTLDPDIPSQTISTFLVALDHEGETIGEIRDRLGMTTASASRNIAYLTDWHRLKRPGLNLLVADVDPMNRRTRRVFLTVKGRQLAKVIRDIMKE
jgi:DNA-binding MarR family transcriptional regulator